MFLEDVTVGAIVGHKLEERKKKERVFAAKTTREEKERD